MFETVLSHRKSRNNLRIKLSSFIQVRYVIVNTLRRILPVEGRRTD